MKIRKVAGRSMTPAIRDGAYALFGSAKKIRVGKVVLARQAGREVVKRIERIDGDSYFLAGDNRAFSTDSREYGPVKKHDILGNLLIAV